MMQSSSYATLTKFKFFYASRALSTFGDEVWRVALPIFFASQGMSSKQFGFYTSAFAVGTILGFLIVIYSSLRFRSSSIAIISDVVQLITFSSLAAAIFANKIFFPEFWIIIGLVLGACEAIWFSASEGIIGKLIPANKSSNFHKANYWVANFGPCAAPPFAVIIYTSFGIAFLAIINALSFIIQIFTTTRILALEKKITTTQNTSFSFSNTIALLKSPMNLSISFLSSVIKIGVLGLIPFIPFILAKHISDPLVISIGSLALPAGSLVGASTFPKSPHHKLHKIFFTNTMAVFIFGALTFLKLRYFNQLHLFCFSFALGYFVAKYTIALRTIRQLTNDPSTLLSLIAAQGLAVRLSTPLSGLLFGYILHDSSRIYEVFYLIVLISFGSYLTFQIARAYGAHQQNLL